MLDNPIKISDFVLFLFCSLTSCDEKNFTSGSLESQRCHCANVRPCSETGCVMLEACAASAAFVSCMKQVSFCRSRESPCCYEISIHHQQSQKQRSLNSNNQIEASNFLVLHLLVSRSYRVSLLCKHCDSYPVTLECTDDSVLWSFLTRLSTEVAE